VEEYPLPARNAQPYAVYVDERHLVWISDFRTNAVLRLDPRAEQFTVFELPSPRAAVRQMLGREGELWGAESATDTLFVSR